MSGARKTPCIKPIYDEAFFAFQAQLNGREHVVDNALAALFATGPQKWADIANELNRALDGTAVEGDWYDAQTRLGIKFSKDNTGVYVMPAPTDHPAYLAAISAPIGEPETPQERAAWEAALASGPTRSHAEVMAELEKRRTASNIYLPPCTYCGGDDHSLKECPNEHRNLGGCPVDDEYHGVADPTWRDPKCYLCGLMGPSDPVEVARAEYEAKTKARCAAEWAVERAWGDERVAFDAWKAAEKAAGGTK